MGNDETKPLAPFVLITKGRAECDAEVIGEKNKTGSKDNNGRKICATEVIPRFGEVRHAIEDEGLHIEIITQGRHRAARCPVNIGHLPAQRCCKLTAPIMRSIDTGRCPALDIAMTGDEPAAAGQRCPQMIEPHKATTGQP